MARYTNTIFFWRLVPEERQLRAQKPSLPYSSRNSVGVVYMTTFLHRWTHNPVYRSLDLASLFLQGNCASASCCKTDAIPSAWLLLIPGVSSSIGSIRVFFRGLL